MTTIRLIFTGLCAHTEIYGQHVIVCPSGLRRFPASLVGGQPIPIHLPFVTTDARLTSDRRGDNPTGDKYQLWIPLRERLDVMLFNAKKKLPFPGIRYGKLNWVANMSEIWPEREHIRRECLPGTGAPVDPAVAMQVVVPGGELSCTKPQSQPVEFRPAKGQLVTKPITRQMVITLDAGDASEILIRSTSLESGRLLDDFRFAVRGNTEITFGNADYADVLLIAQGNIGAAKNTPDTHFELYYDLLEPAPLSTASTNQLPIPVPIKGLRTEGSESNCPVLLTAPITTAVAGNHPTRSSRRARHLRHQRA